MSFNHQLHHGFLPLLAAIFLLGNNVLGDLDGHCPPLGPVLPAPTSPSKSSTVQTAVSQFDAYFSAMTSPFYGSAVSVSVQSIHESGKVVDLHYTPAVRQAGATNSITGDTSYRVGSISKVLTILAILRAGVRMDDPITSYLPELRDLNAMDGFSVAWDDVTVGSLASHMSGLGLDLMNDLGNIPNPWTSLGFPSLNTSDTPGCQGIYGLPPCPESEFYRDFSQHHPVYAPFTTPTYSNLGVDLLGLALEKIFNQSYAEYVQESILSPLGLENTSLSAPPLLSQAFIPNQTVVEDLWSVDLGWDNPAGGFYSTPNDLLNLGTAILNGSLLGSWATNKWLKPVSSTSTVGRDMGAPWEILRSTNLTTDGRLVELYTKGGDIGSYHSKFCLIPDYDLVVVIMTAGPEAQFQLSFTILSQLLTNLLPAIEQAGKEEITAAGMVGTFVGNDSTIELSLDSGPGLNISNWYVRGHEVGSLYASNYIAGVGSDTPVRPRLYSTNMQAEEVDGVNQISWAWRAVFDTGTAADAAGNDAGFAWPGQSCQTWANMDRFPYGFRGIDEFVFTLEPMDDGSEMAVSSLTNRGFQVQMYKQ